MASVNARKRALLKWERWERKTACRRDPLRTTVARGRLRAADRLCRAIQRKWDF